MEKIIATAAALLLLGAVGIGCAAAGAEQKPVQTKAAKTAGQAKAKKHSDAKPAAKMEKVAQANARQSASDYLSTAGFSRSGLIDQLKFEGFSVKDATYGVDAVHANWNEQAAKTAADYLDTQAFSRSGLIEQLEYEGYTQAQAAYGVSKTGL